MLSMQDMWKHLPAALAGLPGQAFGVADALDEMDSGDEMACFSESLRPSANGGLRQSQF